MGAMTNLLVKDDAATPKEWTFIPVTDTPIPFWRGSDSSLPLEAQPRLYAQTEQLKSGDWRIQAKLELPVLETLGASGTSLGYVAAPKVAYVNTVSITLYASKRSSVIDRANVIKMAVGFTMGASSTTATGTLNQASAGSAVAASVLPGPQLFTQLVLPN